MAMASATREKGYTLPAFGPDEVIRIEGLYHPFLQTPVPNDFEVPPEINLIFLTGPNMAGENHVPEGHAAARCTWRISGWAFPRARCV